ncbi:hypothetical protein [uncultured Aquimarina sp.]|uniref:hypothetical protein n=1 Tax=uncultured Aquimarina sp. TaxID=575652 RepID=UPI002602B24A|nr:hypothetical protein [uncultured Aquimarina sp.]
MKTINNISIICILLLLNSCFSKKDKRLSVIEENQNDTMEILCFYKTLMGEDQVFKVSGRYLYAFGKKEEITLAIQDSLYAIPNVVLQNNKRLGCGTCIDSMDYKFIFKKGEHTRTWVIQSGFNIPEQYENYFNLLINIAKEQVESQKNSRE